MMKPFHLVGPVALALLGVACATPPPEPLAPPPPPAATPPETSAIAASAPPPVVDAPEPLATPPVLQGAQTKRANICPGGKYAALPVTETKAKLIKDGFACSQSGTPGATKRL